MIAQWALPAIFGALVLWGIIYLVRVSVAASREVKQSWLCPKCGEPFDRAVAFPTEVGFVDDWLYYCRNEHRRPGSIRRTAWGENPGGESASERLGGWSP